MAGHSKWAGIKHKKAIVDARRGKLFTKLGRAITVAAKEGGGEIDGNPSLALAVQKAKDASMPKDNIERAIKKASGSESESYDDMRYEGYGPGGVAMLIEALTENRNRTGADVRHTLTKFGGSLGEPGSVAYLFSQCGLIVVDAGAHSEEQLIVAIDAGAEEIEIDEDVYEVITPAASLSTVRSALDDAKISYQSAELVQRPAVRVEIDEGDASTLLKLIDALEENDDVGEIHANFEIDAEVLERIAG